VIEDVVLHQLTHEGIEGAASRGQALQDIGAMRVVLDGVEGGLQLANQFLGARNEVELFVG